MKKTRNWKPRGFKTLIKGVPRKAQRISGKSMASALATIKRALSGYAFDRFLGFPRKKKRAKKSTPVRLFR